MRYPRVLTSAVVIASGIMAAGVASPAAAAQQSQAAQAGPSATSPLRVGANYPLTFPGGIPIYGRDAVGLAVNPRNPNHIVAMYSDYKTLWCEVVVSTNQGRTWRRSRLKAPPGYISPPCTVGGHLANFVDAGIAFGKGNNVYAAFASGLTNDEGDSRGKSVLVAKSTNGGRTFSTGGVALAGGPDDDIGPDYTLPKLVVKPGVGAGEDRIHLVANSDETEPRANPQLAAPPALQRVVTTTSNDGGRTWGERVSVGRPGESSIEVTEPVLGRNDTLYVGWRTRRGNPAAPGRYLPEGTVVVASSADQGRTFKLTTAAGVQGFIYTGPVTPPYGTSPTEFNASTFPSLAADPRSGNVYLAYGNGGQPKSQGTVQAADHFIHKDMDVWFQRSTDGGDVWSEPTRLNGQAPIQFEITQTRHPSLDVAPNGRLDVVWQDRRHWYLGPHNETGLTGVCTHTHVECNEARLGDTYYRSSSDGGASFSRERRITDRHINNDVGYDYRFGAYWDYGPQSIALGNNRILFAWMDSRDGNVETDDMNIYFAKANVRGSRDVPVRRVRGTSTSDFAVKMSRLAYPGGPEATLAGTFASRPWTRLVIVNERDFAGALAGSVLGRANLGPVLVTPSSGLTAAVKQEVARMAPIGAYVIGGESSLSAKVISDLAETGVPQDGIIRIDGGDAAGTAAAIATAMDRRSAAQKAAGKPAFREAVIVNPDSPDAGAISVLAAHRRMPVLFADANGVPAATSAALAALNIPRTLVIGSSRFVGTEGLPVPHRVSASTPSGTSRLISVQARRWGLPDNVFFSTDARRKMDAAVMGAAGARIGGMFVLSRSTNDALLSIRNLKMQSTTDHLLMAGSGASTGR